MAEAAAARTGRIGFRQVLALPSMRAILVAHLVSMLGTVVAEVALSVAVFQRTGSSLLSASVLAVSFVPYALGGTLLSAVADRWPARRVLVCCDLLSAGLVAAMVVPGIPVAALLVLVFGTGVIAPVFAGARGASLADLLPGQHYVLGRSLLRTTSQASLLAGFAVGGLLVSAVGATPLLAGDSATFLASAALLRWGTPPGAPRTGPAASARRLFGESWDGVRYVFRTLRLRRLVLLGWAPAAFASAVDGLAVPYTAELGVSAGLAGAMFAGYAAGTVAGELLAARLGPATRQRLLLPLALSTQVPSLAFAVRPSIPLSVGLLALAGAGFAFNQGLDPLVLAATDAELRGRVFVVQGSGLMLVQGLAIAAAGLSAEWLSPDLVMTVTAALGIVVIAWIARTAGLATARQSIPGPHS